MARIAAKDRREALIAAAIRVMVREGVAKTTTRKIVEEAGMNLGAFHYCFTSREELFQEVIIRINDASLGAAQETIGSGADLGVSIAKSLRMFWENVESHPEEQLLPYELSHYALRTAGLESLARRQYAHYLEVHERLLVQAADSAGIVWAEPVPVLARYLSSVLDGITVCWFVDRDSERSWEVLRLTGEHLAGLARPGSGSHRTERTR
jgi:AcrR family transcriptional regulator